MGGGFEKTPGGSSLVQPTVSSSPSGTPGKRTLTEQLPPGPVQRRSDVPGERGEDTARTQQVAARDVSGAGSPSAAVQRKPNDPSAGSSGPSPGVTPPKAGIDKAGFIDNGDGAN